MENLSFWDIMGMDMELMLGCGGWLRLPRRTSDTLRPMLLLLLAHLKHKKEKVID